MKIGILTFHNVANYGAFLQMYALKRFLEKENQTVEIINLPLETKFSFLTGLVVKVINRKFDRDRKNNFTFTKLITKESKISKKDFDLVIVGSDQVWNKNITKENFTKYFFDFVDKDVIKCSYAASFGFNVWGYNQKETETISLLLKKFKFKSVREDIGLDFCINELQSENVRLVLDPTLLLDSEDYDKLISIDKNYGAYVCYKFKKGEEFYDFCKRFNDKFECKIVELKGTKPYKNLTKSIPFPSISVWLSSIKNSKLFITDSFHGVCFSIIFKKQFVVIPADITKFNRIESLLNILGLKTRIFYSYQEFLESDRWRDVIDYDSVYNLLLKERANSFSYLKEILEYGKIK